MPWKMHDKEYANVVALPDFDRYTYMCAKFGDWREVWSLRNADGWVLAGHIVVGWPRGHFGPVRRRSVDDVVFRNGWDPEHDDIVYGAGARPEPKS